MAVSSRAGVWDVSGSPVYLAGYNGLHETRPTRSLARDLADDFSRSSEQMVRRPARDAARPSTAAAEVHPRDIGGRRDRRAVTIDFVPGRSELHKDSSTMPPAGKRRTSDVMGRVASADDRPIVSSGSYSPTTSAASTTPTRHSRLGSSGSERKPSRPSLDSALTPSSKVSSLRAYEPVHALTNQGFDEESSRVALAMAAGDVDKAVRLLLEDGKAHLANAQSEWEFEGDAAWTAFDCEVAAALNEAEARGESACEIKIAGRRYLIDFESMTQFNLATQRCRSIRKRRLAIESG